MNGNGPCAKNGHPLSATGKEFEQHTSTEHKDFVRTHHDRMLVILADTEVEERLGDERLAEDRLRVLCRGLPSEALQHEALPPKLKVTRPAKPAEPDVQPDLFA